MTADWADLLKADVQETLEEDRMGLYEFLYFLRGQHAPLSEAEMIAISSSVLAQVLQRDDVRLVRLVWASDFYEFADGAVPTAADWQTPTERPYLALDLVRDSAS